MHLQYFLQYSSPVVCYTELNDGNDFFPRNAGGGKPENAQASGSNPAGTADAMAKAAAYAMDKLGLTKAPILVNPQSDSKSSSGVAAPSCPEVHKGESMQAQMV